MGYWGNRKPPTGTRIDWSHPNAVGLVEFWPLNEMMGTRARGAVRPLESEIFQNTTGSGLWVPPYLRLQTTADSAAFIATGYLKLAPPLSLVWCGAWQGTSAVSTAIFGMQYQVSAAQPFWCYGLRSDTGSGIRLGYNDNGGTLKDVTTGITAGTAANGPAGSPTQWVGTLTTGAAAVYQDGVTRTSGGTTTGVPSGIITYTATSFIQAVGPTWSRYAAVYNLALPVERQNWLRVEPFDHFEAPSTSPVVFLMSPVTGPPKLAGPGGLAGPYAHLAGNM